MRHLAIFIAVGLIAGCGMIDDHIIINYYAKENINQFEEAGNVAIKVIVVDLRPEKGKEVGKKGAQSLVYSFLGSITAKNDLRELISHAIETELTNRGFKLGDGVLVKAELQKFYNFFYGFFMWPGYANAEMFLTVKVKKRDGTFVFTKKVIGQGKITGLWSASGENAKIALDAALKDGILKLVDDTEFINSLVRADAN